MFSAISFFKSWFDIFSLFFMRDEHVSPYFVKGAKGGKFDVLIATPILLSINGKA